MLLNIVLSIVLGCLAGIGLFAVINAYKPAKNMPFFKRIKLPNGKYLHLWESGMKDGSYCVQVSDLPPEDVIDTNLFLSSDFMTSPIAEFKENGKVVVYGNK